MVPFAHCRFIFVSGLIGVFLGLSATAPALFAASLGEEQVTPQQSEQLVRAIQGKLPGVRPEFTQRLAGAFLAHLRQSAPLVAERLATGRMDSEELESRVDVFIGDHPELAGQPDATAAASDTPRARVAGMLKGEPAAGGTDHARLALADRFIAQLGERSPTACDALLAGKMTADELQSRVSVFVEEQQAQAASSRGVESEAARVAPLVDAFIKANFGAATERATAIAYKGVVEEPAKGIKREFTLFNKYPAKLRIHIVEGGLVTGILATDGSVVWRQSLGEPGVRILTGEEAAPLLGRAPFEHPLINYRERGAAVELEEKPTPGSVQLHLREADGTEMVFVIDAGTLNELSRRVRYAGGQWVETRFKDYRKVDTLNYAYVQEQWKAGALEAITRIAELRVDSGLLDRLFVPPVGSGLDFMDAMVALSKINARAKPPASRPAAEGKP